MEQRLSLVTLGVEDVSRSRRFYEALGWKTTAAPDDEVVFFQSGGMILALWSRSMLAEDSGVQDGGGWGGVTLAHNVRSPEEVDSVIEEARAAGATIPREGAETFWGGYSGVFVDPDGHPWEVAHNPGWTIRDDGSISLTEEPLPGEAVRSSLPSSDGQQGEEQPMTAQEDADLVRHGYEAFIAGDMVWMNEHLHENIVWHVPGHNVFSGDHKGREAVLAFFAKSVSLVLPEFDIHDITASDDHVVAILSITWRRNDNGETLEGERIVQIFHVLNGEALEVWTLAEDPARFDQFIEGAS
jgi:uncharacterized protein